MRAFAAAGAGCTGGGTNLYDLMKLDVERPGHLIDVAAIDGLRAIDTGGDVLRFGALAPMSAVAADPVVRRDYPVLAESLAKAASQQLRNMATVGGNLLQRTTRGRTKAGLVHDRAAVDDHRLTGHEVAVGGQQEG